MKDMIERIREERGGFTLAELLIVVAIILVLVAVAVPVFTGAMNDANKSVAVADIRSARSQASAQFLLDKSTTPQTYAYEIDETGKMTRSNDTTGAIDADATDAIAQVTAKITANEFPVKISVVIQPNELNTPTNP